jgi:hypothetical protein
VDRGWTADRPRLAAVSLAVGLLVLATATFARDALTGTARVPAGLAQYTPPSSGGGGGSSALPPDLHVAVVVSSSLTPAVGADLNWYLTVSTKNRGGSSAVQLLVNLPAGWTYDHSTSDRGSGCRGAAPVLVCDVAWINPSVVTHVALFGKVADQTAMTLVATVKSLQEPEFDPSDNQVTVKLSPTAPPVTTGGTSGGGAAGGSSGGKTVSSGVPLLSGKAVVGSILRVVRKRGAHYQWQVCSPACRAIKGAVGFSLKLAPVYAGRSVRVLVTTGKKRAVSKQVRVKIRAR